MNLNLNLILIHNDGLMKAARFEHVWWRRATTPEREYFLLKYPFLKKLDHPADFDFELIALLEGAPPEAIEKSKKYVRVFDLL